MSADEEGTGVGSTVTKGTGVDNPLNAYEEVRVSYLVPLEARLFSQIWAMATFKT